jgi:drug/metabolite transporter (DMT)-like permease
MRLDYRHLFMLAVLAATWGSSFILMKKALIYFSPAQLAAMRIFLAGFAMLPIAIKNLGKVKLTRDEKIGIAVVALLGNTLPAFLFATAQMEVPSGISGVLNSMVPLFTLLLGGVFFRARITLRQSLLMAMGFAGALLLVLGRSVLGAEAEFDISYALLILLATICYSLSTNTIHRYLRNVRALVITSYAFSAMLIPMLLVNWLAGTFDVLTTDFSRVIPGLIYIGILALVGTSAAVVLFNVLIKETNAVFASTVTYLIPIVAVIWGWIDGEVFSVIQVVGFLVILGSVWSMRKRS